jgi:thiol-disulfide isomerase/thioredoxin
LQELWKKAVHIEGGTFHQPLPIQMKGIKLGVSRECAQAHARDSYDEWCETCWDEFQDVVKQLDTLDLTPQEREFHRMLIEQDYLNKLRNFMFAKTSWKSITDKDSLAMFEKQFTFKDPHVSELTYYRNITGFYACLKNLFNEGKEYIEANGLEDSPLGRWYKELDEAKAVMTRVKARLSVTENQLNALSPEFQVQIKEIQALMQQEVNDSKGTCRDLPEGAPQEWLPKIVAGHKGRVVFIDYWATCCGPCRTGMKAMESVKDELTARGVDFVYITDTSSNADDWLSYAGRHAGDH